MSIQRVFKLLKYCNRRGLLTPAVSLYRKELKCYSKTGPLSFPETRSSIDENEIVDEEEEEEVEVEDLTKPLVKLTVFFPKENVEKQIEARVGTTVFRAILKHDRTLMQGACKGQLTCRTCHCLVEEKAMKYFSKAIDSEEDLLDAFANCKDNSRLSCQMRILEEFENVHLEVVPEIIEE